MFRIIVFGGTTEGRKLCEFCSSLSIPVLYCVATKYGAINVDSLPYIKLKIGRLESNEMKNLMFLHKATFVVDATHPYAKVASTNILNACKSANIQLLCVTRKGLPDDGCTSFNDANSMLKWLKDKTGNIFITTGSSDSAIFTQIADFQSRVWLRILPSIASLKICLDAGYKPERLICMQGPFSEEMNLAMFKDTNAKILVTKNSGNIGGFTEKIRAAKKIGMDIAVLSKPNELSEGVSLEEVYSRIKELISLKR